MPSKVLAVVQNEQLDGAMLRHVKNERDLEEIGVAWAIHRRRLLELLGAWKRQGVPLVARRESAGRGALADGDRAGDAATPPRETPRVATPPGAADSPTEIKLAHGPTLHVTTPVRALERTKRRKRVFISFRVSEALEEAKALAAHLETLGFAPFVCEADIMNAEDWVSVITEALRTGRRRRSWNCFGTRNFTPWEAGVDTLGTMVEEMAAAQAFAGGVASRAPPLSSEQEHLHARVFSRFGLQRPQTRALLLAATRRIEHRGAELTTQGTTVTSLGLLVEGAASVHVDGTKVATINPFKFVGEVSWLNRHAGPGSANASCVAEGPLDMLSWSFDALEALVTNDADMGRAVDRMLHADVVAKIHATAGDAPKRPPRRAASTGVVLRPEPLAASVDALAARLHAAVFAPCGMGLDAVAGLLRSARGGVARAGDELTTRGAPVTWLVLVYDAQEETVAVTEPGVASATCVARSDASYVAWDMAALRDALRADAALADDFHRALRRDATRKLQTANATTTSARAPKLAPIAPTAADGTAPNSPKP
ncbi:hypothetical protein JL722_12230 [Aureococcus anophagefferens]|nr:hypothetical protein JL722_12230 [Aureococcus anophagefferens]